LFSVLVSMLSFARKRRMVLLSIPHFSLSWYVEKPFSFIISHSLSEIRNSFDFAICFCKIMLI